MRLLEVMVMSPSARGEITALFEEKDLDYAITDNAEDPDTAAVVKLPLPAHAVESIQRQLKALDLDSELYTVVVNTEAVVSGRFDGPWEANTKLGALGRRRVSRDELHSKAADLLPNLVVYVLMTALSAVVATAGVLLDSMPVLVGAMVIAPLVGPSMATSTATVIYDEDLFAESVKYQALGMGVGLLSSVAFALFVRVVLAPKAAIDVARSLRLSSHTSPTFLLVAVALAAGSAGAVSLSTSGLTSLVGVMIAAALMPPIGVVGVGIAWGRPMAVLGSSAVVLENVFSINLAATVCLWYFGYHPENWADLRETRGQMLKRMVLLSLLIVALGLFLLNLDSETLRPLLEPYL
jgi:uncharacterized hydrophobic protein (TIGR00341 family)